MQDIKSRELREKDPNANTKICFEVRVTALRPCHTQKDFNYPLRIFHKGPPPRNYDLQSRVHNSNFVGRHKARHKAKKEIQYGDHLDYKQDLIISKDHKKNLSQYKIVKDRF